MKKIMLSVCALGWLTAFAQEQTSNEAPVVEQAPQVESPWKRSGTISLLFNQAAFNHDWTGGGTNNYGGNPMMPTIKKMYGHGIISSLWIMVSPE